MVFKGLPHSAESFRDPRVPQDRGALLEEEAKAAVARVSSVLGLVIQGEMNGRVGQAKQSIHTYPPPDTVAPSYKH